MKKLALISLSLLLISCRNKQTIILNKIQTEYELVGYTPDSFEVYRLYFSDEYGTNKGFTYYVKKIDKKDIPSQGNNK
jgi:hypothetical protein